MFGKGGLPVKDVMWEVRHATSKAPTQQQCNYVGMVCRCHGCWNASWMVRMCFVPFEPKCQHKHCDIHHHQWWLVGCGWLQLTVTLHIGLVNGLDVGPLIPVQQYQILRSATGNLATDLLVSTLKTWPSKQNYWNSQTPEGIITTNNINALVYQNDNGVITENLKLLKGLRPGTHRSTMYAT